jgi:hypothetical protein
VLQAADNDARRDAEALRELHDGSFGAASRALERRKGRWRNEQVPPSDAAATSADHNAAVAAQVHGVRKVALTCSTIGSKNVLRSSSYSSVRPRNVSGPLLTFSQ